MAEQHGHVASVAAGDLTTRHSQPTTRREMIVVDATPLQSEHRYRGSGTYAANLLDALTRLPHPQPLGLLVQAGRPTDLPLLHDLLARSGVVAVPLRRPHRPRYRLQWLWSLLSVEPALRRARARLYHGTEPDGLVMVPGVTTLFTLCDLTFLRDPAAHLPLRRPDQRAGYARFLHAVQRADRLIAISNATARDAVERLRIPPERITVIPLAADERRFYPRPDASIEETLRRYGLRRPYFLHVGASVHHKNTANILRAFALFCRDERHGTRHGTRHGARHQDDAHALYIAGAWSSRPLSALHARHGDLMASGRLRVLGFVPDDDLAALYSGATALVYPSLYEGFGLPVLEAMRCATPVLTSTTSSLPEVAGDAALLVDPHEVEAIAAGLRRLAAEESLRADLIARGLRRAASFSWTRTARETLQVYAELL